jgi:hypothetical protein
MGYYINPPQPYHLHNKATWLIEQCGGTEIQMNKGWEDLVWKIKKELPELAVVFVLNNGPFEAAGYAYSDNELKRVISKIDFRPCRIVIMDKNLCQHISGYESHNNFINDDNEWFKDINKLSSDMSDGLNVITNFPLADLKLRKY